MRVASMRAIGAPISARAGASSCLAMATLIRASTKVARPTVRELTLGAMAKHTMVNGSVARSLAMVYGGASLAIAILANGKIAKQKDMVCIHGLMETGMKESGNHA